MSRRVRKELKRETLTVISVTMYKEERRVEREEERKRRERKVVRKGVKEKRAISLRQHLQKIWIFFKSSNH